MKRGGGRNVVATEQSSGRLSEGRLSGGRRPSPRVVQASFLGQKFKTGDTALDLIYFALCEIWQKAKAPSSAPGLGNAPPA